MPDIEINEIEKNAYVIYDAITATGLDLREINKSLPVVLANTFRLYCVRCGMDKKKINKGLDIMFNLIRDTVESEGKS